MEKGIDRRVQRTRLLLREAMLALVVAGEYDAITIQEITDQANLGRATFYLHYRDKEDLLVDTLEEVFEDLIAQISEAAAAMQAEDRPLPMIYIFHHAARHSELFRALFQAHHGHKVLLRLQAYMATQIEELVSRQLGTTESALPMDLWTHYVAGAFLSLVRWWLEEGMPYSPEYMEHAFRQLCLPGIYRVLESDIEEAPIGLPHAPGGVQP